MTLITNILDEVMVLIISFSLVSTEQQGSAVLPANHQGQTSITINIGHICSCGPAPGSVPLCVGPGNREGNQTGVIGSRS